MLNHWTDLQDQEWHSNGQLIQVTQGVDYGSKQLNIMIQPGAATQAQANAINGWLRGVSTNFRNISVVVQEVDASAAQAEEVGGVVP